MTLHFPENLNWHSPAIEAWFLPFPKFKLQAEKCALLIIDIQNYVANPDVGYGPLMKKNTPRLAAYYYKRLQDVVIPSNRNLLNFFRKEELCVLFTRVGPQLADGSDMIRRRQQRDQHQMKKHEMPTLWSVGTYEHAIIDELQPNPEEYILDKNSSGAFNSTGIDQVLRNMSIEDLIITGLATDMCVETTARDAADRGFNVVIVEDGTATFEAISHVASLYNFAKTYGMVRNSEEVIRLLKDDTSPSVK
jgi:nicotinamidase-related amidase